MLARSTPVLASPAGLADAAARSGLFFGSAVRLGWLKAEADLRAATLLDCSWLTPEIALKWAVIEPERGTLTFAEMDELNAFALNHGKKMRGHTLLWHLSVPAWAEAALPAERNWRLISSYFASVIPRYGQTVTQWDVVNEPIQTGGRADGLRENVFLKAFGPDYIPRAFEEARRFAPHGHLMLNEYGLEYDDAEDAGRRRALLKLLEQLKTRGAPIDGVGLQSHLDLRKGRVSQKAVAELVREVTGMGLYVTVTELDVKEADYTATPQARDQAVADEVGRYLDVVLRSNRLTGVATWGLSSRHSWVEVTPQDYARFPNAWRAGDGPGVNRGLPYSAAMARTPMYSVLKAAFDRR